jgi:predicted permease
MLVSLDTSAAKSSADETRAFYRGLLDRARGMPGVASAALTSWMVLDRGGDVTRLVPEGYQMPRGREYVTAFSAVVDERFFDTMKIEMIRGRAFTADDKTGARGVTIVNEEFARRYWPDQDPVGKRIRLSAGDAPWLDVVGLTKTSKYLFVAEPPTPFLYLPFAQHERQAMTLVAEATSPDASFLAGPLRDAVRSQDVNQPIVGMRTFSSLYEQRAIGVPLLVLQLVTAMAAIGLILALVGLYGLVAYSVSRRTREIGLRMAIGAASRDVLTMVLRGGLMLSTVGVLIGGLASVAVARALASGMVGLGAPNPAVYVVVPILLVALTLAASYVPARRASRVNPTEALRCE